MTSNKLIQNYTIGIVGGGQLGKMMAQSALRMGFKVVILDPSSDAPARSTCTQFIEAPYNDEEALIQLCELSDVITYEFENIDSQLLEKLASRYHIPQGAETLSILQNRETEKKAIEASGAKIVPFKDVHSSEEIVTFIKEHGYPVIVKTSTGGYDGKGQYLIEAKSDLNDLNIDFSHPHVVEKYLDLKCEVSLTVARSVSGQTIYFNLQENVHLNQILYRTIAPASVDYFEIAKSEVDKIMSKLHFVGSFTVEFFVSTDGELYVNEIAPRPHNSGHYSIEACNISQFDAHILSILDLPMPKVHQHHSAIMMNLLGKDVNRLGDDMFNHADWHVHLYGKSEVKDARKMGHITILTDNVEDKLKEISPYFEEV